MFTAIGHPLHVQLLEGSVREMQTLTSEDFPNEVCVPIGGGQIQLDAMFGLG
jgi:hypothetical protein